MARRLEGIVKKHMGGESIIVPHVTSLLIVKRLKTKCCTELDDVSLEL
jgi:hypothetical protein